MLALHSPRSPAPVLACRGVRLRPHLRPNAFGQALANAIIGQMAQSGQQEVKVQQSMANNRTLLNASNRVAGPDYYARQQTTGAVFNWDDVDFDAAPHIAAADQRQAEEDWARATRSLATARSMNGVDLANYRLNPKEVVAGATQGITSLLTSAQYGADQDGKLWGFIPYAGVSPMNRDQLNNERALGLSTLNSNWGAIADDSATRGELMRLSSDYFSQDGVRQRNLLGQVELAVGLIKDGDATNVVQAANLATALGSLRRNPFAVALLSATIADSRNSVTAAVNQLADSSALEYNGGRAWNFATARDIASGVMGGMVGLAPLMSAGSRAINRAWTDLNRSWTDFKQSIPDLRQNPFAPELSRGSSVRVPEKSLGNVGQAEALGANNITPRTFVTKDPGVPEVINAIEAKFPGKVRNAEIQVYRPDGTPYTDFDIVTDTHVIQVKVGTGKGIVSQIQTSQSLTDLEVIGFDASNLLGKNQSFKGSIMQDAQQKGIYITNNIDALLQKIGTTKTNGR